FPSQVETVLLQKGYQANYQIIVDRIKNSDTMEILVEIPPERFTDSLAEITEMEKELSGALKAMLGIYARVRLVSPKSITRSEGKAVRVIDKRKI
ncbi:MAG: phenylacetate--CoA ligase, partial [Lachnospiraceae bacterium]|nr:phenylacetate--CoA ligase [Lachnospiraceae bacterium]